MPFVPDDWELPAPPGTATFVLAPLGPEHNEPDHRAWMSSIEHIHATPGWGPGEWDDDGWPFPMALEENLGDLEQHAAELRRREAFAYTVLDRAAMTAGAVDVVGCVYIEPDTVGDAPAMIRSWVRADRAAWDAPLAELVRAWLAETWPFTSVRYAGRP